MDFIQRFERYKHFADECIMKYLPKPKQEYEILAEAMEYALLGGGKRIRPVLLLAVCEMCGGTMQSAGPAAAAIEIAVSYTHLLIGSASIRRPSMMLPWSESAVVTA